MIWLTKRPLLLLLIPALVVLLVFPTQAVAAQSSTLTIQGDNSLFNYSFDFCHYIGLGSCNVGIAADEAYSEQVQVSTSIDHSVLQPGNSVTLTTNTYPQGGTATIRLTFTLGSKSYSYSWSLATPGVGSQALDSASIPLSVFLSPLGISSILPIPGSFTMSFNYNSLLYDTVSAVGFSSAGTYQWSVPGAEAQTLSFDGTHDTSSLGLGALFDNQAWQISFDLTNLPLINQVHLYALTVNSQQYGSNIPSGIDYYHVTMEQPVGGSLSSEFGSAWYIAGYQLSLNAVAANSYSFQSWSTNGQTTSNSPSYSFAVYGPTDVTANFAKVTAATGAQGAIQGVTDFLGSTSGIVFLLVLIAIIAGVAVWRSRKSP